MSLVVLTGASAAGKTTIAQSFAQKYPNIAEVYFFDSIPVPSLAEMTACYGSPDEWQRVKTVEWMKRLADPIKQGRNILFEGQTRTAFIREGVLEAGISKVQINLIDCNDATRFQRLTRDRHQPELATERMMDWARFLREEALREGESIIDTSGISVEEAIDAVRRLF